MKKLAVASLAVLFSPALALTPSPAQAQNQDAEMQACEAALIRASDLLVGDRHLWIVNIEARQIGESYQNYPYQKPMEAVFVMDGNAVDDVMNSPRLLTSITQGVTDGCQNVGIVSYAAAESDWVESYGLIGSQIRQFECTDPGEGSTRWGYVVCL